MDLTLCNVPNKRNRGSSTTLSFRKNNRFFLQVFSVASTYQKKQQDWFDDESVSDFVGIVGAFIMKKIVLVLNTSLTQASNLLRNATLRVHSICKSVPKSKYGVSI